jgi:hypothetical protein
VRSASANLGARDASAAWPMALAPSTLVVAALVRFPSTANPGEEGTPE